MISLPGEGGRKRCRLHRAVALFTPPQTRNLQVRHLHAMHLQAGHPLWAGEAAA